MAGCACSTGRRPPPASAGLLRYKPQIWVLVPLALLARAAVAALAWMSAPLRSWRWRASPCSARSLAGLLRRRPRGGLGARGDEMSSAFIAHDHAVRPPHPRPAAAVAGASQLAGACWRGRRLVAFRASIERARTAVLVTATFLVSPYTLNYDLLLC
jgi:hypothetical protein